MAIPCAGHDGNFRQNPANAKAIYAEEVANELKPQEPDTDLLALMSGRCSTLKVAGRDFACRTVAYAHSTRGRAYFTIALDDPADHRPHHLVLGREWPQDAGQSVRADGRPDAAEFQEQAEGRWPAGAVRRIIGWNVHAARKLRGGTGFQHRLYRDRQERQEIRIAFRVRWLAHYAAEGQAVPADHPAARLEHDLSSKWELVFPRDKREAFARRSCSNKEMR